MRKFSKIEKDTIQQIVEGTRMSTTYLPINAFNDIFQHGSCIGFDMQRSELLFYCRVDDAPDHRKMLEVLHIVTERALLVDYLVKDGMVYFCPMNSTDPVAYCGDKPYNMTTISIAVDQYIADILFKCMNRPVYVGQTLRNYVDDDFLSLEEQSLNEAKKQTFLSWLAVLIAIITMLIGSCQGCSNKNDANAPVSGILNYMKNSIENKLDAIQENTANIKTNIVSNVGDTVIVKCCHCRHPHNPSTSPCIKRVKINTCRDTVVSKKSLK